MDAIQRRQQIGRIHAAKSAIGMDDDAYRRLLDSLTGCTSCKDMDDSQVNHALDWLNYLSGRRARQPMIFHPSGRDSHANLVRVCYAVAAIVPPGFERSPMRSMHWQERTCGRCATHFESLDIGELVKLVEGLKAIYRRADQRCDETLDSLPLKGGESPIDGRSLSETA